MTTLLITLAVFGPLGLYSFVRWLAETFGYTWGSHARHISYYNAYLDMCDEASMWEAAANYVEHERVNETPFPTELVYDRPF